MDFLTQLRWSPYVVGVGIGILGCLSFLLLKKPLGTSTSFAKTSGMLERLIRGPDVNLKAYYQKYPLKIDWQWMFVLGIFLGSLVSSVLSKDFELLWVPSLWASTLSDSPWLRVGFAFIGGIVLGFGARWGNGCTSGHGISGTSQLAISSWIFTIMLFLSGILTAHLVLKLFGG